MATFDTLCAGSPAPVQATARAARAYIRSLGGDVSERCDGDEAVYLRAGRAFCALIPGPSGARLRLTSEQELRRGQQPLLLRVPTDLAPAVRARIRAAYDAA